ncbi:MAG: hypothetical protein H8E21_17425 [Gammaproteobacteria bacterium]|nr:hypothetical protein [Gammaproteobacteria bacterium]
MAIAIILSIMIAACSNEPAPDDTPAANTSCQQERQSVPADTPIFSQNPRQLNFIGNAVLADIGLSAGGSGLAIWSTSNDSPARLYANKVEILDSGNQSLPSWENSVRVDSGIDEPAFSPAFSMEPCGNAILSWQQGGSSWYRTYDLEAGWGNAMEIDTNPSCSDISINLDKTAFCIYVQATGDYQAVYSRSYQPPSGWSEAQRIDNPAEQNAARTSIAVDANGNAIAVWLQESPDLTDIYLGLYRENQSNIWANRYDAVSGWSEPVLIEHLDSWNSHAPKLAMNMDGNAYVTWTYYDRPTFMSNAQTSIYFNNFSMIAGWGNERILSAGNEINTSNISLSVNALGRGIVSWNSYHWQNLYLPSVTSRQFDESGLFSDIQEISIGPVWAASTGSPRFFSGVTNPVSSINDSGQITTVWTSPSFDERLFINTYTPEGAWGDASLIEGMLDATSPKIKMDRFGRSLIAWNRKLTNSSPPNVWAMTTP